MLATDSETTKLSQAESSYLSCMQSATAVEAFVEASLMASSSPQ